ncbi:MAG TPA: hypothetical protein VIG25_03500 [Pyrinomonadaceae bacterium]|jgi:hypothetical protein
MGEVNSEAKPKRRSIWPHSSAGKVVLVGIAYFLIGYGSALLDPFVPDQLRFPWRLTAWVLSGVTFAAHIAHEVFRLRNPPLKTASQAAAAVAIGAFLLAIGATTHAFLVQSGTPRWRFFLALVLWPIITAVPAFLVAFIAAAVLSRLPTRRVAE